MPTAAPPPGFHALGTLSDGPFATTFEVAPSDPARRGAALVCKRLSARFRLEPEACATIEREGRILERLAGRGSTPLVLQGRDEHGPFLVTLRAPGEALSAFGREAGVGGASGRVDPPPDAWSRVAERAFGALAEVHEATDPAGPLGIIHADLSPDNVFVDERSATLLDFGLSSWRGDPAPAGGAFRGTLAYVAPEVARGETFDARADLFALAAAIAHAASGEPPRRAATAAALLASAAQASLDAYARRALGRLLPGHAEALARCLAFRAEDRPARARNVFGPGPW